MGEAAALLAVPPIRMLLEHHAAAPAELWCDRVMAWEEIGVAPAGPTLAAGYGMLLAEEWLEARVSWDTLGHDGRPHGCYRATNAGRAALAAAHRNEPAVWAS